MKKKYKVTSIPSQLPKARNGGSRLKNPKFRKNKSYKEKDLILL